jgi:hypothetical protein
MLLIDSSACASYIRSLAGPAPRLCHAAAAAMLQQASCAFAWLSKRDQPCDLQPPSPQVPPLPGFLPPHMRDHPSFPPPMSGHLPLDHLPPPQLPPPQPSIPGQPVPHAPHPSAAPHQPSAPSQQQPAVPQPPAATQPSDPPAPASSRGLSMKELQAAVLRLLPEGEAAAIHWGPLQEAGLEAQLLPHTWASRYQQHLGTMTHFLEASPQLFLRRPDGAFYRMMNPADLLPQPAAAPQPAGQAPSSGLPAGPHPGMLPMPMAPRSWAPAMPHQGQQPGQQQGTAEHALSSADSVVGAPSHLYGAGPPMHWGSGFAPMPIGAPHKGPEVPKPVPSLPNMPGAMPAAAAVSSGPAAQPGSPQRAAQAAAQPGPHVANMLASLHSFPMPGKPPGQPRPAMKEMVVTPFAPGAKRP